MEREKIIKIKDRSEEKEVKCAEAIIVACRAKPHLAFGVLKKMPLEQLLKLAKKNSVLCEVLESYWCSAPEDILGHQLAYQRVQWFHEFPEHQGNELEFEIGVISNDCPVEYLHDRFHKIQLDEHGIVMVVKAQAGHLILLTNYDLTQKKVIPIQSTCNFIRVYRSSKIICVTRFGSTGQTLVYCRQTGNRLYTFQGIVGKKILDNHLDEVFIREYNGPILSIYKLTKTGAISVYETTGCCGMKLIRLNIMPSAAGQMILSVCISCWKVSKSALKTKCVVWELQINPRDKNPDFARSILVDGVFIVDLYVGGIDAVETIFIDSDLGSIIEIDHDKDGKNFYPLISKQLIVLTWQKCGYRSFSVYNRNTRQVTRTFQVSVSPTEHQPYMNLVQERILVVTHMPPDRFHRIRIMVFDIKDQEPATTMRIFSDSYKCIIPTNLGLLEISANHWGTLTICRKHFKTLGPNLSTKKLLHNVGIVRL